MSKPRTARTYRFATLIAAVAAAATVAAMAVLGTGATGATGAGPTARHRVDAPGATSGAVVSPDEFTHTANPVSLDPPVQVPPTTPTVVTIVDRHAFGNAPPPAVTTTTLPAGNWATIVLDVTGTESGRQYDRLMEVFDGASQIFLGVTPEPTPQGISWHVRKDVTGYLPVLTGTRTFTTTLANYLDSIHTGVPVITAKLLFYPTGGSWSAATRASLTAPALSGDATNLSGPPPAARREQAPDTVVPVVPAGSPTSMSTINAGQTLTAPVSLPPDVTTATLDLYAVGQSTDEFWWGLQPAFREIEISIDGRPAGVVWPYPYIYTGGVNPLLWRPLTAIHTLDLPAYRVDLTPFAGLLHGTHTVTVTVANNAGYWLASGNLLVTESGGGSTGGAIVADTLTFPTTSTLRIADALHSSAQTVSTESAHRSYRISGYVTTPRGSWVSDLRQALQYSDDQTNIAANYTQYLHSERILDGTDLLFGPRSLVTRHARESYTLDAPNAYLQSGADFLLPAQVSQNLTEDLTQNGGSLPALASLLSESLQGYASLEEDNQQPTITDGATTGTVTYRAPDGSQFWRTIVTRGGQILRDLVNQ